MDLLLIEAVKANEKPLLFQIGTIFKDRIVNELLYVLNFHNLDLDVDSPDYYKNVPIKWLDGWIGVELITGF